MKRMRGKGELQVGIDYLIAVEVLCVRVTEPITEDGLLDSADFIITPRMVCGFAKSGHDQASRLNRFCRFGYFAMQPSGTDYEHPRSLKLRIRVVEM